MSGAVNIAETGAIRFIMFYVIVISLFGIYISQADFTVFNSGLENPADIDLTASLDPLSMIQKIYFMSVIAVDPSFIILGLFMTAYSFVAFYIIIKALPFT